MSLLKWCAARMTHGWPSLRPLLTVGISLVGCALDWRHGRMLYLLRGCVRVHLGRREGIVKVCGVCRCLGRFEDILAEGSVCGSCAGAGEAPIRCTVTVSLCSFMASLGSVVYPLYGCSNSIAVIQLLHKAPGGGVAIRSGREGGGAAVGWLRHGVSSGLWGWGWRDR